MVLFLLSSALEDALQPTMFYLEMSAVFKIFKFKCTRVLYRYFTFLLNAYEYGERGDCCGANSSGVFKLSDA